MITPKREVLHDMTEQLSRYIVVESTPMNEWKSYDGDYLGGGKFTYSGKTEAMHIGDHWFARYDCARIFKTSVTLPEHYKNGKIYLHLDFGGESIVRIGGKAVNSVSSRENSGWVARDTVIMNKDELIFGTPFEIELETCVDSASFCDAAMAGEKEHEYTLKSAAFLLIDEECEKYYLDCKLIWDSLPLIKDEFIYESVYKAFDDSLHMVDFDFDDGLTRESIKTASAYLDGEMAKIGYTPQAHVIMDGHSHIDIAWLWRIQETERKGARTFLNTLALMDAYPEYTFTQSQAILYDMMKKYYPDIFNRIKEKVKNGQWNIAGNTWVECDTNIASGESMVRQLLYGSEFFKKEFGVSSKIYWLPDCFGFSWALPQIIKRSSMEYFITSKLLNQDTNRFPHTLFRWRGADGSEILAYNQRTGYQGEFDANHIYNAAYNNDLKGVLKTSFGMFGYGDGGGGSTYRMLERAKRLKAFPGLPSSEMGHPQKFFEKAEEIREDLPVYNDELYYENHRGTYTSQAFIKKGNRKSEFLLSKAEALSVFAELDCRNELEELWKLLLKNQFHDILPGTSIHEAMEDCRPDFKKLSEDGTRLLDNAIGSVSAKISANSGGIAVFNMLSQTVSGAVTVKTDKSVNAPMSVFYKNGERYIRFLAENVSPMGYKLIPFGEEKKAPAVKCENGIMENSLLRVEFDENGILTSVYDKENGRETLSGKGNLISVFLDKCVHETAWNLEQNYVKKEWTLEKADSVEILEANSVRAVVRTKRSFNKSLVTQDMILYASSRQLIFETAVDWQERDKVMKAAFDVNVLSSSASFEAAHGAIDRPTHRNSPFDAARFEQCAHKWADLSEGDYGVSILNDCKYGYDILGSKMRITLMRAPTCPDTKGDLGLNTFTYSYYPHADSWQKGGTVKEAFMLNFALIGKELGEQEGILPSELSFLTVQSEDFIIDAVKPAQNGNGIIIRGYESCRFRGERTITLAKAFNKVTECNLMEENEREIGKNGNSFSFFVKPFEVKTFRVE